MVVGLGCVVLPVVTASFTVDSYGSFLSERPLASGIGRNFFARPDRLRTCYGGGCRLLPSFGSAGLFAGSRADSGRTKASPMSFFLPRHVGITTAKDCGQRKRLHSYGQLLCCTLRGVRGKRLRSAHRARRCVNRVCFFETCVCFRCLEGFKSFPVVGSRLDTSSCTTGIRTGGHGPHGRITQFVLRSLGRTVTQLLPHDGGLAGRHLGERYTCLFGSHMTLCRTD